MKTLAQRTQAALDAGFTVGALSKAAGKSSSAASQWLKGTTKTLKADSAIGLEALTGWSAAWWATGKGTRGETKSPRQNVAGAAEDPTKQQPGFSAQERQFIADLRELLEEDRARILTDLAKRADQMRRHAAMILERAGVSLPAGQDGKYTGPERRAPGVHNLPPEEERRASRLMGHETDASSRKSA